MALNYASQAIEDLKCFRDQAALNDYPLTAQNLQRVIDWLHEAVKVELPEYGRLVDSRDHLGIEGEFHLPFPVVALEYSCPDQSSPFKDAGEQWNAATRRMALAIEFSAEEVAAMIDPFTHTPTLPQFSAGALGIFAIDYIDKHKKWVLSPVIVFVENVTHDDLEPGPLSQMVAAETTARASQRFSQAIRPWLPELCRIQLREQGSTFFKDAMIDTAGEVTAVLSTVEALTCRNVTLTDGSDKPSAKLNKKRIEKGRAPLYEHKILTVKIEPGERRPSERNISGSGTSPRQHLRRGHIRRVRDEGGQVRKNIWIQATVVNPGSCGKLDKTYQIKP